jgi:hypothetical protein
MSKVQQIRVVAESATTPADLYVRLVDGPSGGTTIVWPARFRPRLFGTGGLYRRGIESFLRDCAQGLAAQG